MKNSQGFSLIEVLITIVLTTIGILGMVALQSKSIQYTQDAVNRNTAIALTNELVEIMRANRGSLFEMQPPVHSTYSELSETSDFYKANGTFNFTVGDCGTGIAQGAKQQAGCWLKKAQALLPAASDATIASSFKLCPSFKVDGTTGVPACAGVGYKGSTLTVQVAWRGKEKVCGPDADSDICTFNTRVEL